MTSRRRFTAPNHGADALSAAMEPWGGRVSSFQDAAQQNKMAINSSLAYSLSDIDPHIGVATNDHGRLASLRPLLRAFAASVGNPSLVDVDSDGSFGSLLAPQARAELGKPVMKAIFGIGETTCKTCLVCPSYDLLTPQEADQLPESERERCIAIRGEAKVAIKRAEAESLRPHVVLTVPTAVHGGLRDAKMNVEPISKDAVKVSMIAASGARKYLTSGKLPEVLVERLFQVSGDAPQRERGPGRANVLPRATQSAIATFLEKKRFNVLCTAAEPAPVTRRVVVENAYLRPFARANASWASLRVVLHASSSSCVCPAHDLRIDGRDRVEITIKTCGRDLEQTLGGKMRCPCHKDALGEDGNSRNNAEGLWCTEGTTINLRCLHSNGDTTRAPGARLDNIPLTSLERLELESIISNALEFEARTRKFFNAKGFATNQSEIDRHAYEMGEKLNEALEILEMDRQCQLVEEDGAEEPIRDMPERDQAAVDLMRAGGVRLRLRIPKGGIRKVKRNLERKSLSGSAKPLSKREAELVNTHGHLFRKAL